MIEKAGLRIVAQKRMRMSREEAETTLLKDINRDYTDEQLQADGQTGALIGLFPVGVDLKAEMVSLLKSQVAGFYDPRGKRMVMVKGAANFGIWTDATEFLMRRDVIGEMLLAHEYTHALQDQHFGLEASLEKIKNSDDQSLALNFTNEVGAGGKIRLLKNIAGLWLLQECRRAWALAGCDYGYEELSKLATAAPSSGMLIDPDAFPEPGRMPERIAEYCRARGHEAHAGPDPGHCGA